MYKNESIPGVLLENRWTALEVRVLEEVLMDETFISGQYIQSFALF